MNIRMYKYMWIEVIAMKEWKQPHDTLGLQKSIQQRRWWCSGPDAGGVGATASRLAAWLAKAVASRVPRQPPPPAPPAIHEEDDAYFQFHGIYTQTMNWYLTPVEFQLANSSPSKQQIWYCNSFVILAWFGIQLNAMPRLSISISKWTPSFFYFLHWTSI